MAKVNFMTLDQLIPALIQLPFLGIFVWFSLKLLSDFRIDSQARDKQWREFLIEERKQRLEAMKLGLEEVKHLAIGSDKIAHAVSELAITMRAHDAQATERHASLIREIARANDIYNNQNKGD